MARKTKKSDGPRRSARGLSARAAAFVREYLIDLNGTAAAVRAGYAERSARSTATALLKTPAVAAAIEAAQQERARRADVSADRVIEELGRLAFANIRDFIRVDAKGQPEINLAAIADNRDLFASVASFDVIDIESGRRVGRTTKIRFHDKQAALTTLLKHLGGLPTQVNHSGRVAVYDPTSDADRFRSELAARLDRIAASLPRDDGAADS
ncbi:terminase small subunit [Rhodomicrobium lacus]|uniref:terminase small subunit n=1 Tax=Rhodomicrobium lacus TaxID=2498452 RepID=UPI000F8CD6A4|nr:terminase small subunit [Rhodomicrobium lacus]